MTGLEVLFLVSMAVGGLIGAVIGFLWTYRTEKKRSAKIKPSLDRCLDGALKGLVAGILWLLFLPGAIIFLALASVIVLIRMALEKTGKFDND